MEEMNKDKSATPREVFERQMHTIQNLDTDGQADLFAEDGVMEFPPFKAPYIQVFRIRNGEIVSMRDYFSGDVLRRAMAPSNP